MMMNAYWTAYSVVISMLAGSALYVIAKSFRDGDDQMGWSGGEAARIDLRYPLVKVREYDQFTAHHYGPWRIAEAPWMRPHVSCDWDWWHDDYDGVEDANDHRAGTGQSLEDCIQQIHDWEDEQ